MVPLCILETSAGVYFIWHLTGWAHSTNWAGCAPAVNQRCSAVASYMRVCDVEGYSLLEVISHWKLAHQGSLVGFNSLLGILARGALVLCCLLPCLIVLLSLLSFSHSCRYLGSPGRPIFVWMRNMTLQDAARALMGQWVTAEPSLWGIELAITARSTRSIQWSVPI